jgi:hypothetical protein
MTVATKTPIKSKLAREALRNGWDLTQFVIEATGLDDRELARALMVMKSTTVTVEAKRSSMQSLIEKVEWHKNDKYKGLPMWVWRSVLELEAKRRPSLSKNLVLTTTEPTMEKAVPSGEGYIPMARVPTHAPGRTMSQCNAKERKEIWLACTAGGGGPLSYEIAEREFGLKQRNGMTAWRVCRKHEKTRRKQK